MKNSIIVILFLFLFTGTALSQRANKFIQSDTLVAGTDTLVIDTLYCQYNDVYVIQTDTATTTSIDSVFFESWSVTQQTWVRIGAVLMNDNSNVTFGGVAGTSASPVTRMYKLNDSGIYILRQRLLNSGAGYVSGRRVLTSLKCIQPY